MSPRLRHLTAWTLALGASVGVVAGRVGGSPPEPERIVAGAEPRAPALRTRTVTRTVVVEQRRRRTRGRAAEQAPRSTEAAAPEAPSRRRTRSSAPRSSSPAQAPAPRPRPREQAASEPAEPAGPRHVDGSAASTRYGPVQVRLVLEGSRITRVLVLVAPNDSERSRQITADAMPRLEQQVIAAQSAQIDGVAGATYTAQGYRETVQSALDAA